MFLDSERSRNFLEGTTFEELYAMFNSNQNGLNDKTITSNQEKYGVIAIEIKKV